MAPRPYWSGHVRLSLVTFPVRLFPAIESRNRVTLHQVHKPTGERIRYQKIVPDLGPVDDEEIVKGYEYERGSFVYLEEEEFKELQIESSKTIDLVQFCELDAIDDIYVDRPYFIAPDGKLGEEAFRVIRDALRASKKVALGQVVLANRERIAAIRPCGKGMILETLRYGEEIREAEAYFDEIKEAKPPKEQVDLAKQIIQSKTAAFDPDEFQDRYQTVLRQLIESKLRSGEVATGSSRQPKKPENVIDLTEALKKSIADGEDGDDRVSRGSSSKSPGGAQAKTKSSRAKKTEQDANEQPETKQPRRRSGSKAA